MAAQIQYLDDLSAPRIRPHRVPSLHFAMGVSYRLNLSTFDTFTEKIEIFCKKRAPAAYGMRRARVWLPFLQAALTSFPAAWAGAFQGGGAGRNPRGYPAANHRVLDERSLGLPYGSDFVQTVLLFSWQFPS